jgi:hypothetical protein
MATNFSTHLLVLLLVLLLLVLVTYQARMESGAEPPKSREEFLKLFKTIDVKVKPENMDDDDDVVIINPPPKVVETVPVEPTAKKIDARDLKKKLATTTSKTPPPNIIFMLADDLGWDDIHVGLTRSSRFQHITPELSRFARMGTRLLRHYTEPWCLPSRSALLTGISPARCKCEESDGYHLSPHPIIIIIIIIIMYIHTTPPPHLSQKTPRTSSTCSGGSRTASSEPSA